MKKTLQTLTYLTASLKKVIGIGFLVILGTVAVTDLTFFLTAQAYNPITQVVPMMVPFEFVAGIFCLLAGFALFIPDLRVALANGISRKTFLLAGLPAAGVAAAAFSLFNLAVELIHNLFWPVTSIIEQIYHPSINWAGFLLFQFVLYFLLVLAGRLITLAYYRSSLPVKWAISLSPVALFIILQQDNAHFGGVLTNAIWDFIRMTMQDPYRASASMLAYSAILVGLVYLLVRRAPLKD